MARVNLRSISNLTTARQRSKEGKRFSFLGFFPFSKDTTRAMFIASLPILPVFPKPTKYDEVFKEARNREDGQHERENPCQLQDHQNGNPQNDMEGMSQTFSVLQQGRGECLMNKSRSFFKHEMEASLLPQEDKKVFNELHTSGHWSAGTPTLIPCNPHIFRAFVFRARIQNL
jgi:hypothetical protein